MVERLGNIVISKKFFKKLALTLLVSIFAIRVLALEDKDFTEKEMGEISQKLVSCNRKIVSEGVGELLTKQEGQYFRSLSQWFPANLYWVGRKDEAVFWLELYLLRKKQEIELRNLDLTMKIVDGPAPYLTIHNYARQNINNYISITEKVVDWDRTHLSYLSKYKGYDEFSVRAEAIRKEFLKEKKDLLQYKDNIESYEKSVNEVMQTQLSVDCPN